MAVNVCPKFGAKHRMISKGFAAAANHKTGKKISGLSGWYKCSCGERVITEGHPHFGYNIGKYVTEGGIKGVTMLNGAYMYKVDANLVRTKNSPTLSGYGFYEAN